jgi:anti-sigma factor ChrR (cupin superfamily)
VSREELLEVHLALDKTVQWAERAKALVEVLLEGEPGATQVAREEAVELLGASAARNAARRSTPVKVTTTDDQDDADQG